MQPSGSDYLIAVQDGTLASLGWKFRDSRDYHRNLDDRVSRAPSDDPKPAGEWGRRKSSRFLLVTGVEAGTSSPTPHTTRYRVIQANGAPADTALYLTIEAEGLHPPSTLEHQLQYSTAPLSYPSRVPP